MCVFRSCESTTSVAGDHVEDDDDDDDAAFFMNPHAEEVSR